MDGIMIHGRTRLTDLSVCVRFLCVFFSVNLDESSKFLCKSLLVSSDTSKILMQKEEDTLNLVDSLVALFSLDSSE